MLDQPRSLPPMRSRRLSPLWTPLLLAGALVLSGCGTTEEIDASADIATLESSTSSAVEREDAAEATTSAPEAKAAEDGGSADTTTDTTRETVMTTATNEATSEGADATDEEEISEDDAQDILNGFSACMRNQGYDNFPDIVAGGNGAREIMDAGINPLEDQFSEAFEACGDGLEELQSNQPELSPEQRLTAEAALLAGAVCMRESGYENFPDPDFSQGYGQGAYLPGLLASGIDLLSPEFRKAGEDCSRKITDEYNLGEN